MGANSGQQVKNQKLCRINCPLIKKAFFYLNVLDIPPNSPEQEGKNALKFAMQNRIKLFYRSAGIAPVNKATFKKLLVNRSGNGLVIKK
ncbi:fimbria/pilus periplasmic chaperone [Escherichia coli]|nr:fimbria/pilus periplasmic chaperone [Escherichia coli]